MENDITMEMNEGITDKKKSKLPLIGIGAAVLLFIIIVVFAVVSSPKVMMGILIGKTPKTVTEVFEANSQDQPLFMRESHQSETKLSMKGEDLGLEGDVELEILTAYQNSNGDLAAELEFGLGDLDAISAGLYLGNSEVALISSILSEKYIVDIETETELEKDTTLEERLMGLLSSKDDKEFDELMTRLRDKVLELRKIGIKELPRAAMDKGREELEIFGNDKNIAYVEAVMDQDYFNEWAEIVLDEIAEDNDLEDLVVEIAEYLNDTVVFEDEFDVDDIDLEEYCEDMIDELDDIDAEFSLRIYHIGFTPVAYEMEYEDDYSEGEVLVLLHEDGKKIQMLFDADIDGEEMYYNVYEDQDEYSLIEYEMDDMKYEVTVEKVKSGLYEINGTFDYGDMGEGKVEGQIEETRNETTFDIEMEMTDSYGMETEVKYEGSVVVDGSITTTEASLDVISDGEDVAKIELECTIEEVKKNKEYTSEGKLEIVDVYSDTEYVIDFENEILFGDAVEVDLPNWSKNDVYAKITDKDAMNELFDSLSSDAETGFADIVSLIFYGGIY